MTSETMTPLEQQQHEDRGRARQMAERRIAELAAAPAPWSATPPRRPASRRPATPDQPRFASRRAASAAPVIAVLGSPLKPRPAAAAQVVFLLTVDKEKAPDRRLFRRASSVRQREQRLAVLVLDLRRPDLLDRADDLVGHRDVVEVLRPSCRPWRRPSRRTSAPRAAAAGSCGCLCIRMKVAPAIGQDVGARLVGQDHAEARRAFPVGVGGGRHERLRRSARPTCRPC